MIGLSVVIPCLNEIGRLRPTVDDILAWSRQQPFPIEIIVADSGSTDGTMDLVMELSKERPEVRLVRVDPPVGKGAAVRAGMRAAGGARRAFVDADGAVPFAEIARLEAALDAGADVAVGSRTLDPSRVESLFHRRFVGFFFRRFARMLVVRGVEDTQCGFKLFCSEAAEALFAEQLIPGYAFDVEVLGRAERLGLRVAEVAVLWRDRPGSKVRVLRDGLAMVADVIRVRLHFDRERRRSR